MSFRVVHYINQFFAGIGGEEKADHRPEIREGIVGPGQALQAALGDQATVVATVICGDGYFAENIDGALEEILALVAPYKPDLLVAGPAFNAGRYGTASGGVCAMAGEKLGIPTVTGMHPENPGVDMYRKNTYIVETADSARGLRKAMPVMAALGLKLLEGRAFGHSCRRRLSRKGCAAQRISFPNRCRTCGGDAGEEAPGRSSSSRSIPCRLLTEWPRRLL